MRANDKVTKDVEDAKHDDGNRLVRGRVYGEGEGVETEAVERDHETFNGIPFSISVEPVFHGERVWVPDAGQMKHKRGCKGG